MSFHQAPLFDAGERKKMPSAFSLVDQLLADSKLYRCSQDFKDLLDFAIKLRNVAPFNAMLLKIQKPGVTFVASALDWENLFERQIKENARPLIILWPFGPVAMVYDVQDTEGKPLPEDAIAFYANGTIVDQDIKRFQRILERRHIAWKWMDAGDGFAGEIVLVSSGDGKDIPSQYRISINENHDTPTRFVTLVHELAHLLLGHLGQDPKLHAPDRTTISHEQRELEAESVAYIVCRRSGVTPKSHTYLSQFVTSETTTEQLELYQIMRVAGSIESLLGLTRHTQFTETKGDRRPKPQRDTIHVSEGKTGYLFEWQEPDNVNRQTYGEP
ncbi:ImmA/IrrE family metallo-endopeptidase [Pirellulaceae bacterium SH449]